MKYSEIKNFSMVDLKKKIHEMRSNLFVAKMKCKLGRLASPIEVRRARRDIARLQTALTQLRKS